MHSPKAILDDLVCDDTVKVKLLSALKRLVNDPRKFQTSVERTLSKVDWRWPWLEKFPDTLEIGVGFKLPDEEPEAKCHLLAHSLMMAQSKERNINGWLRGSGLLPYLVVIAGPDKGLFPECRSAAGAFITRENFDEKTYLLPLHRPGCRCTTVAGGKKQLERWGYSVPAELEHLERKPNRSTRVVEGAAQSNTSSHFYVGLLLFVVVVIFGVYQTLFGA